ncbi:MAG: phage portal protein [bacterium]|jgi:HK97 family phage portal protein
MANFFTSLLSYFRLGTGGLTTGRGLQIGAPSSPIAPNLIPVTSDRALQLDTIWACIDRRATTIASLPFFVYSANGGTKSLARTTRLYQLLHDSPNSRMTPFEFWRAMILWHDLRGVSYARIDRDAKGEAVALWPMPSDQVQAHVQPDGAIVYAYRVDENVAAFAEQNVLVLKNLGNGTTALDKLEFMRASIAEAAYGQQAAVTTFANGGKSTGILMLDQVLTDEQRVRLKQNFADLAEGSTAKLKVLEAGMKYESISITPEQQQLLESRKHSVEQICRWYDVPPVLVHHSNVTAWGSGIEQIIDGFYKFSIRPMLVNIEQAVRKRVLTPTQRATLHAEWHFDALLRGSLPQRMDGYAKAVQNGLRTRNECRQLENDPPLPGGDELTAQSNLVPLTLLGKVKLNTGGSDATSQNNLAQ